MWRMLVGAALVIVAVGACSGGTVRQPALNDPASLATPRLPAFGPTLQPVPAEPVDVDTIVAEIMAGIEQSENVPSGAAGAPLPPSLELAGGGAIAAPNPSLGSRVVEAVCGIAKIQNVDNAIESVVNEVLEHAGSTKRLGGLGLIVLAANAACPWLVAPLNDRLLRRLPSYPEVTALLPTPPPIGPPPLVADTGLVAVGAPVIVNEAGRPVLRITVNQVQCKLAPDSELLALVHRHFAAHITIEALAAGEEFDASYWSIDGDGIEGYQVFDPDPDWPERLTYGVLAEGGVTNGWLIASVLTPKRSVTVTYHGNPQTKEPVFHVEVPPCAI